MALPSVIPAAEPGTPAALTINGLLVAAVELQKFPSDYQPCRRLWLFRSPMGWTVLTLARNERWLEDGNVDTEGCSARAVAEAFVSIDDLAAAIRSRYGDLGWSELLDTAAANDGEMFRTWAPVAFERDLLRATFRRPDLVGDNTLSHSVLGGLADEVIAHLEDVGFRVIDIEMARRAHLWTEQNRIAVGTVRRYGCEADIVVRIDADGEIYTRVDGTDGRSPIRCTELDDA